MNRKIVATVAILMSVAMLGVGYAAWLLPGGPRAVSAESSITVQGLQTETLTIQSAVACEYDSFGNQRSAVSLGADLDAYGQICQYPYRWVSFDRGEDLDFTLEMQILPEGQSWQSWSALEAESDCPRSLRIWLDGFAVQDESGDPLMLGDTEIGSRYVAGPTVGEASYVEIVYDRQAGVWSAALGGEVPIGWGVPHFLDGVLRLPLQLRWGSAFTVNENGVSQAVNPNRYFNHSPVYDDRFAEMADMLARIARFDLSVRGVLQAGAANG